MIVLISLKKSDIIALLEKLKPRKLQMSQEVYADSLLAEKISHYVREIELPANLLESVLNIVTPSQRLDVKMGKQRVFTDA